jgi:hypothetical protein
MEESMRRSMPCVIALLGAAVVLAACGGGDDDGGGDAAKGAKKSQPKQGSGYVEDQLGFDTAGIMARQSRVEVAIRDCMKDQGFDYVPVDPAAQRAAITGSSRLSDEDFLKQFGYGISTLWGRGSTQADPNVRVRASMGAPDRRAYDRALWGENSGATFTEAVDSGNFSRLGGCTKKATEDVFGGAEMLTRLQRRLDQLDDRILEDQRMVRALESWTECMADAGYRYEDPDEIDSDLFKRMEKLVGPLPGQFATGPPAGQKAQPFDKTALTTLQREEVAIARADFACEEKHITPVENKVRPEYEAKFRDRNEALLGQVKPIQQ